MASKSTYKQRHKTCSKYTLRTNSAPASERDKKQAVREAATMPRPCDLLTSKVVSESRVTWPISVPILVFLGLSVLDLGPMCATDRQTSDSIIA